MEEDGLEVSRGAEGEDGGAESDDGTARNTLACTAARRHFATAPFHRHAAERVVEVEGVVVDE